MADVPEVIKVTFTVSSDCSASNIPFPGANTEEFERVQDALYRIHHRPSERETLYLGVRVWFGDTYRTLELAHIWDKWGEYKPPVK